MKKLIALVLVAALVSSCNEDEKFDNPDNSPVEIKLSSGIDEIQTKAPVNSGDSITAQFAASTTNGNYAVNAWGASVRFKASAVPTTGLSFLPQQFYPINGDSIYIKGYYPAGTLSAGIVTFSGPGGANDIMITGQAVGTRAATSPLSFVFTHLLSQLQFRFVAGAGYNPAGKTITRVVIKNQQIATTLNLSTGIVGNIAGNDTITGAYTIAATAGLPTAFAIVAPGVPIILSVTNSDGITYPDITFDTATLLTLAGNSHLITLTFSSKEITASVSVTDWVTGGTGSAGTQ